MLNLPISSRAPTADNHRPDETIAIAYTDIDTLPGQATKIEFELSDTGFLILSIGLLAMVGGILSIFAKP